MNDPAVLVSTALALGAAYALVGVAVSTVALATRTLHLAVGPILVVGVLVRLLLGVTEVVGVPDVVAVLAGLTVGALLSALLEPLVLGRLRDGLPWLIGLVVAAAVLETAAARWLATRAFRPQPLVGGEGTVELGGAVIGVPLVVALLIGLPTAVVLAVIVRHTRWGRRLRVVGASPPTAERSGFSPAVVRASVLALCGAVAVLAGLLIAPVTFVGVGQAAPLTVRAVAAAALLGPGGPRWAVPGGFALGAVEAVAQSAWPRAGGEVGVAVLVVALLVWRGSERSQAWGRAW
ncbi:MAG: hypothetical protein KY469_07410 [Actinobacteria bacterium]|nr:hypothetical protein [Actinomycetota bacterium]